MFYNNAPEVVTILSSSRGSKAKHFMKKVIQFGVNQLTEKYWLQVIHSSLLALPSIFVVFDAPPLHYTTATQLPQLSTAAATLDSLESSILTNRPHTYFQTSWCCRNSCTAPTSLVQYNCQPFRMLYYITTFY